jgi:hypothetical protein
MDALGDEYLLPPLADIVKDYLAPKEIFVNYGGNMGFRLVAGKGEISLWYADGPAPFRSADQRAVVATAVVIIHCGAFPHPPPAHQLCVHYMDGYKEYGSSESDTIRMNQFVIRRTNFPPLEDFVEFCRRAGLEPVVYA